MAHPQVEDPAPAAGTHRLRLRRFVPGDLEAIAGVFTDPRVARHTLTGVLPMEAVSRWLERIISSYRLHEHGVWAVVHREDAKVIGYCGLSCPPVDGRPQFEIGFRLLPAYWGRGLATEAAAAARDVAFGPLALTRVICLIQPENAASIRVAEKIGMRHERDTLFANTTLLVYALDDPAGAD